MNDSVNGSLNRSDLVGDLSDSSLQDGDLFDNWSSLWLGSDGWKGSDKFLEGLSNNGSLLNEFGDLLLVNLDDLFDFLWNWSWLWLFGLWNGEWSWSSWLWGGWLGHLVDSVSQVDDLLLDSLNGSSQDSDLLSDDWSLRSWSGDNLLLELGDLVVDDGDLLSEDGNLLLDLLDDSSFALAQLWSWSLDWDSWVGDLLDSVEATGLAGSDLSDVDLDLVALLEACTWTFLSFFSFLGS